MSAMMAPWIERSRRQDIGELVRLCYRKLGILDPERCTTIASRGREICNPVADLLAEVRRREGERIHAILDLHLPQLNREGASARALLDLRRALTEGR